MKDEFIPYEQAVVLKELGFNEPCLGYWNIDPYLPKPTFNLVKPFDHEWCVPAPLYQQAFRWFREKHNILIPLSNIFTFEDKFGLYDFSKIPQDTVLGFYPTYEEVELACLIKLIEIVKIKEDKQ